MPDEGSSRPSCILLGKSGVVARAPQQLVQPLDGDSQGAKELRYA